MRAGLILLTLAYVLSQFYRAFLAVLSPALARDLGAGPSDLATATGLWFLVFAAMQIPVGALLDRIGPRRTAASIFAFGAGGGALVFALASAPWHISVAMTLIGIGCSPVLMASYYTFARLYPPATFATLAALVLGIGSVGNLLGSAPLAWMVEAWGWRATMGALSGGTVLLSAGLWLVVTDPPPVESATRGSLLDLLKIPALWLVFPLMFVGYAPAAGLRGLWIGPYLGDMHGADTVLIGNASLVMGVAMIAGTFLYGPLDRWLGTRKWVVFAGNAGGLIACATLALWPAMPLGAAIAAFAAVGFFCASFPMIVAHGRAFFPPHLAGRGITLMNLFGIGGVGLFQVATGRIYDSYAAASGPQAGYQPVFGLMTVALALGLALYLFSRDRTD
ncbi:MFS transporter [Mesobacterium pallidum]|uniref:MFS transporter n=1 Tax=Mesobacterium pallidum TaxID=2872037 RepID=UPI001EE36FB6|nr:MFS transporter [Mesobacterium pallidum]